MHSYQDLFFDDSFILHTLTPEDVTERIAQDAARLYLTGASVQVLSPYNATVFKLNGRIRDLVNPASKKQPRVWAKEIEFRDGDRVLITQNDRFRQCYNGEVGIVKIRNDEDKPLELQVHFNARRRAVWYGNDAYGALNRMDLGYAITVHRSQGSEYDTVLMPISMQATSLLHRKMFYTAISRAKARAILYGDSMAIDLAMHRNAAARKSMLVTKTHQQLAAMA